MKILEYKFNGGKTCGQNCSCIDYVHAMLTNNNQVQLSQFLNTISRLISN